QMGQNQDAYTRMVDLFRGGAETSKAVKTSKLVYSVATNSTSKIKAPVTSGGGTEKRFKITVKGAKFDSPRRRSTNEYIVSATKMTPTIQRINRTSGTIASIVEIA
ncbi:MAG: photosystem I reaction center subunit XII, partial [Rivularia sp. ALOHA_DT_140]|nr:photosystem I reaction center subunit XII [Rivularia sp. ALOHA_DT_140]